jgi:hypothetical protein
MFADTIKIIQTMLAKTTNRGTYEPLFHAGANKKMFAKLTSVNAFKTVCQTLFKCFLRLFFMLKPLFNSQIDSLPCGIYQSELLSLFPYEPP